MSVHVNFHLDQSIFPSLYLVNYMNSTMGADKSLARPGRKQVTATEDFYVHVSYVLS
jgi:hypothetical protein